jgi:hypothetical protein
MKKDLEIQKDVKPPLGLIPKWIREKERLDEVQEAILRYYNSGLEIPIKWVIEYNELIKAKN